MSFEECSLVSIQQLTVAHKGSLVRISLTDGG